MRDLIQVAYMIAAVLFIIGLQRLSRVRSARGGNLTSLVGMAIAILATAADLLLGGQFHVLYILIPIVLGSVLGLFWAYTVPMTSMPQMVGVFNGFGGLASMFVAYSYFYEHSIKLGGGVLSHVPAPFGGVDVAITVMLSVLVGAVTFSGSMIAAGKLQGWVNEQPVLFPGRHVVNVILLVGAIVLGIWAGFVGGTEGVMIALVVILGVAALILGVGLTIPIGGADMPVVICLLNAYSGIAGALTGFVIKNNLLIIAGSLVGSSGIILTDIMCKAMNRSLANVLFGGFGAEATTGGGGKGGYTNVKSVGAEEVAMLLESASSVIFAPGYGLAVAQAQHAAAELGNLLEKNGIKVSYAIHPVAGRMPGHMNVLLAEANVPYDKLYEMDAINDDFKNTDVVIVLGANDVVNPVALHDKSSPIYGMPILKVHEARTVIIVKRSLGAGFAGIKNELFEYPNAMMFFSDAKAALQKMKEEFIALKK
jgi:NAD(P) transhydrogenase subunit beta